MRIDTHVHTHHSGYTGRAPLTRLMRESYNPPARVDALAKARGMDLRTAHGERFTELLLLDLVARPPLAGQAVVEAA